MTSALFLRVFVTIFIVHTCLASNILILTGLPSHSHHIWYVLWNYYYSHLKLQLNLIYSAQSSRNRALFSVLPARGHNITVLSADVEPVNVPNWTYLRMENVYDTVYGDNREIMKDVFYNEKDQSVFHDIQDYYGFCTLACQGER